MSEKPDTRDPINLQDPVGRVVGKRRLRDAFGYGMKLQKAGASLSRAFGCAPIPKGVFRFRSFEEADAWMDRIRARPKT